MGLEFKLTYGAATCADKHLKSYSAGTKAFLDTLCNGLVPCVVTRVIEPGRGTYATEGKIEARITKTVGAYKKDEIVEYAASKIVPTKHIRYREYSSWVNTFYRWVKDEEKHG